MQLDQQQMAAALNTPYGTYRGWETGRVNVPGIAELALPEAERRLQKSLTQGN
jgi:DNA-binding transcriptional regulator YiaG